MQQEVFVQNLEIPDFSNKSKYDHFTLKALLAGKLQTKKRLDNLSPIVFGELKVNKATKAKYETVKILLDTGCTTSIINDKIVKNLSWSKGPKVSWKTSNGYFNTTNTVKVQFTLFELWENREISTKVHTTTQDMGYDFIIGLDLIRELGINIRGDNDTIQWGDAEIPLRPRDTTKEEAFFTLEDPEPVKEAVSRIESILDAKYKKANLDEVVKQHSDLNKEQRLKLLRLLRNHESLFDGTLGTWTGDPYSIHLKDDVNLSHGRLTQFLRLMREN